MIDLDVAREAGVHSVENGLVFPWRGPDGRTVCQLRPDDPGDGPKYLWPAGERLVLWVHPRMVEHLDSTDPVIVVEGTRQYLAAVSHAPARTLIVGIVGCQGWREHDAAALSDLKLVAWEGRDVTLVFDADVATNPDVYDAAAGLAEDLHFRSAAKITHARLPGGGSLGLDDVLAEYGPKAFGKALDGAGALPKRPQRKRKPQPADRFFDENGLIVGMLADEAEEHFPMAVSQEDILCVYGDGVYSMDRNAAKRPAVELLGDRYRPFHAEALRDALLVRLRAAGRLIPAHASDPILNVKNGLLDLTTLELHEHSPDFLTTKQLAVEWNPEAECPVYEAWVVECVGDQVDDLEEAVSTMLDPSMTPTKALFAYGPSRSGKSTFIRLAAKMASPHVSSVTLHQLATDRFAAANVYGAILNSAADLSAGHVEDLSTFKMLTGEDSIQANRKYGAQFTFTNTALFAFSTNEIPSVGESSRAYLERVKPIRFPNSFAGAEDSSIERTMIEDELEGILRRWVEAYGRFLDRGGYGPSDPEVLAEFARGSDRVTQWVAEETTKVDDPNREKWTPGPKLLAKFTAWAEANHVGGMGRNKFYQRLEAAGVARSRTIKHRNVFDITPGQTTISAEPMDVMDVSTHMSLIREEEESKTPRKEIVKQNAQNVHRPSAVFDLETTGLDVFGWGAGFIRLVGLRLPGKPSRVSASTRAVMTAAEAGIPLVAHNGFGFDFVALAEHDGLDVVGLGDEGLLIDTKILAFLDDPPPARLDVPVERIYGLDATAERLGVRGKTDDLKALAAEFGGFDKIPPSDQRYRRYCRGDVDATKAILDLLPITDYAAREMRVLSRLSPITTTGFRVDLDLLGDRLEAGRAKTAAGVELLVERYGLPLTKVDGTPAAKPHATKAGKEAIAQAFADLGVDLPTTDAGNPSLDQATMLELVESDEPKVALLAETVLGLNGVRSTYGDVERHLVGDRVHPQVDARQASGRLSVVKPGMTVMGKRGGKYVEREIFLPDPGEVLVAVDLDQIDARAVAAHAGDPDYAALFEPGRDLHAEVAEAVFGDRSMRETAKAISHLWNYGGSVGAIVRQGASLEAAETFDAGMRERFPRLVEWQAEIRAEAKAGGLLDNGFGRMMRPSEGREHTQAPALIGQGCARDLMMEGLLRLDLDVVRMLRVSVHDEFVFSIPADIAGDVTKSILDALSFEWRGIPITAGATDPGPNWGALYAPKKEAA